MASSSASTDLDRIERQIASCVQLLLSASTRINTLEPLPSNEKRLLELADLKNEEKALKEELAGLKAKRDRLLEAAPAPAPALDVLNADLKELKQRRTDLEQAAPATTVIPSILVGLPPANNSGFGNNSSVTGTQYPDVELENGEFHPITNLPTPEVKQSGLWLDFMNSTLSYSTETEVASHVRRVLQEISSAYGLEVQLLPEQTLDTSRPDILIMRSHGFILGVIEVKKEVKKKKVETDDVFGPKSSAYKQMNHYLHTLMNNCGVAAPFGIITTYDRWIFCWFPHAKDIAEATHAGPFNIDRPVDPICPTMCCSALVPRTSTSLVSLIASFFIKCHTISRCELYERSWLMYSPDSMKLKTGPAINTDEYLYTMPHTNTTNYYLRRFLGAGTDGKAILVTSESLKCCVAKFCSDPDHEIAMWKKAYPNYKVRLAQLHTKTVVMMPYFDLLTEEEFNDDNTRNIIIDHVKELFGRGVVHGDLARRHVGWSDRSKSNIVFIDWGRTSSTISSEAEAVQDAINCLYLDQ